MFVRCSRRAAVVALAALAMSVVPAALAADEKIPVKSADDLPRHTYQVDASASEIMQGEGAFSSLATQVRDDVHNDLDTYLIEDPTTLQELYSVLMRIAMLERDYDTASEMVVKIRQLEDKEASRLMTGQVTEAMIDAWREVGTDDRAFRAAFRRNLHERLAGLPWDVVGDELEARKSQAQIFSENLIMGLARSQLDPIIERQNGEISGDIARAIVQMGSVMRIELPMRDVLIGVYEDIIEKNRVEKADIWAKRDVTLPNRDDFTPVVAAIWDSGVDTTLFPGQMFVNDLEIVDGQDNDDNGYVDDIYGIGYDVKANKVMELLHPLDDLNADISEITAHMKGFIDAQAAIDSPEATAFVEMIQALEPAEIEPFIEDLSFFGAYSHGTHVAGIAAAGNPHIRLLAVRMSFPTSIIPPEPTFGQTYRDTAMWFEVIRYLKENNVRVVNMSWGGDRQSIEGALEANGVGASAAERAELARRMYKVGRDGLYEAMRDAPDILFVTSAGNADNDVEFGELIPSGFDLPNLMVVGAVDQAGDPTDFTSSGRNVQVYANGFEVDSYIPGGQRMKLSGTSMSSPNAVNLAAKVLAVDPTLTPQQVIELMKQGADRVEGDHPMLLMNPRKTLMILRERMAK